MALERPLIRRPEAAQLAPICALLAQSQLGFADLSLAHLQYFRLISDAQRVLAVGGLAPLGRIAVLRSLAVAADQQGQGLATRLVQALETEARRLGLQALYLLSARAAPFFARQGFSIIAPGDLPAAISGSRELAGGEQHGLTMVKILRATAHGPPAG
ncbi:MAG: GNAT family N-acetyltransferase [Gammaproteobacteria bacterium]|nr:GNAT family N-acetyltransferase [Gammaproteobacteria bacterium]